MSSQLPITQTSPAGPIARSVCICRPPPTYPPGGEIWSPVLNPGGQFSVRAPHNSVIGLFAAAKFEIQTLSLPSMVAAHGPAYTFIENQAERLLETGLSIRTECISTGVREVAARLRRKVEALLPDMSRPLVL